MANLTADEIVEQALGRIGQFGGTFPSERGSMYRRIGYRQRRLVFLGSQLAPAAYGTSATANLATVDGQRVADLSDIASPVPTPEMIERIEVLDHGTSPYADGDEISVVVITDQDAELAPRALLRDKILIGVGTDLDLVTSIRIWYARLSDLFTMADVTKAVELEAPWDTLLELDLIGWLLAKSSAAGPELVAMISGFKVEEAELLADYRAHLLAYAPAVSRFLPQRVIGPPKE